MISDDFYKYRTSRSVEYITIPNIRLLVDKITVSSKLDPTIVVAQIAFQSQLFPIEGNERHQKRSFALIEASGSRRGDDLSPSILTAQGSESWNLPALQLLIIGILVSISSNYKIHVITLDIQTPSEKVFGPQK